jgi:hypothetical protein
MSEKKDVERRLKELRSSISLLQDALEKVLTGDNKYFKVILSQLRALLCSGSRALNPLLINIADEKKIPLLCYGPSERFSDQDEYTVLKISNFFIGLTSFSPSNQKFEIKDWMLSSFIRLGKDMYSPNEIIRMLAEKEGGVHYDDELPEKLVKLRTICYSGQYKTLEEKLLIQTTQVVIGAWKAYFHHIG